MAHDAAQNGDLDQLKTFGDVSLILNAKAETVMHTAIRFGHVPIFDYLLERFPQMTTAITNKGKSALHYAVKTRNLAIVEKLVRFSTDLINDDNGQQVSVVRYAVYYGVWWAAALMLSYKPTSINQIADRGQTLIHDAVLSNDIATMRYLLTVCQPSLLRHFHEEVRTPLHEAIALNSIDMVKLILDFDPTLIDVRETVGKPPIFAVRDVSMLTYLSQRFPHILKQTASNENLLYHLSYAGDEPQLTETLLRMCPDLLDESARDCESALHVAYRMGENANVNTFLRFKPDFIAIDKEGNTSLHMAVQMCDSDVVLAVFQKSPSNLYCANAEGKTPLHLAVETKNTAVVEMFQPHMTADMAGALHDACFEHCNINLKEHTVQQCATLNNYILPDITSLVFDYFFKKKRKRED